MLASAHSSHDHHSRSNNTFTIALLGAAAAGIADIFYIYLNLQAAQWQWQLLALLGSNTVLLLGLLATAFLVRRNRLDLALVMMFGTGQAVAVVVSGIIAGLGIVLGLTAIALTAIVAPLTMPTRHVWRPIATGVVAGIAAFVIDRYLPPTGRYEAPADLPLFLAGIITLLGLVYTFFLSRQFRNFSLRGKLIMAFLGVALIPLGALTFYNDFNSRQLLTETANQSLSASAGLLADSLESFFDTTLNNLIAEAGLPIMRDYLVAQLPSRITLKPQILTQFEILKNKDLRISEYILADTEGQVVYSNFGVLVGKSIAHLEYFNQPKTTGQPYISPVVYYDKSSQGSIYFSVQVRSNFKFIGVLAVRYRAGNGLDNQTSILFDLIKANNERAGTDSFAALFDENNLVLAYGTEGTLAGKSVRLMDAVKFDELNGQNRLPPESLEQIQLGAGELDQNLATVATAAKDQVVTFTAPDVLTPTQVNQVAVARLTSRPWTVAFFQPQKVFLSKVDEQTTYGLGLSLIIAAIVAILALLVAQVIAGPIARLTLVAEKVAQGDLNARAHQEAEDETGKLARTFNGMTEQLRQTLAGLEARVGERTAQLRAAAEIGQATASVRELNQLLPLALSLVRERFGFYHASIFLLDESGEFAVLRESTGEVGAMLKARGHRLAVGSQSLIGWVTWNRKPRVALDVGSDPFYFKNPLLPETRSELAIPLIIGDRLIGVLDVQSRLSNAFGDAEVQVLQTLANQLSVAIENAELFQRTQANLAEMSALYQKIAGTGWRGLLSEERREKVYEISDKATPNSEQFIELPLFLRGQQVGALEFKGRATNLTPEEKNLLESAGVQLAVALESAALFDDAQRRSRREQLINEITDQMRSTLNPTTILHSGIRELGRALGATEVVAKLSAGAARPDSAPTSSEG